ncbi:MAG: adenylate/guanylate cyclase domain-containing protein, partial [Spirochaetaceae bacterium]|nr:adenylate/guanylate cyclase domain-containing protein [Spirochaetaceae bacterium]
ELLLPGRNILTLRLRGDPTYRDLGFFYGDGYYIGSLSRILRNTDETFSAALIGIYFFMGLYHLAIGAAMKKDRYNLYYGLFSLCLGFYFFTRSHSIYLLVADQNLVTRLEFLSLYLALPLGGAFLEELAFRRVSRITRIYGAFFGLLGLSQLFFSLPYALDTLVVWQYCALAALAIILVYDLGYALLVTGRDLRSQFHDRGRELSARETVFRVILRTPLGNIGIGVVISIAASIIDVVNSLLFSRGVGLSSYVFLIVTVGAALILARRVGALYSQQQRIIVRANKGMNARLVDCIIVQDHDPSELASLNTKETVMFTDIRNFTRITGNMGSQTTTDFLSALNEVMAKPIFAFQDKGFVAYTDKFIGDGTMNVFSDPAIALESAVEMRKQLSLFNKNPDRYFSGAPPGFRVDVGTGLAHGPMTVGVMGHSRRVDYTHIGGTVNLASRLETLTKAYRVSILLNGGVYQAVDTRRFNLRLVDRIRAKGMSEPVEIYEEFSSNSPAIRDIKQELLPQFRELQEMYFSGRDWPDALALADEITRRVDDTVIRNGLGSDSPGDPLPQFYAKRMRTVLKTPELLAQWDGVYTFDGE